MELFEHVAKPLVADLIHGKNGESTDERQKEEAMAWFVYLISVTAAFHPTKLFAF